MINLFYINDKEIDKIDIDRLHLLQVYNELSNLNIYKIKDIKFGMKTDITFKEYYNNIKILQEKGIQDYKNKINMLKISFYNKSLIEYIKLKCNPNIKQYFKKLVINYFKTYHIMNTNITYNIYKNFIYSDLLNEFNKYFKDILHVNILKIKYIIKKESIDFLCNKLMYDILRDLLLEIPFINSNLIISNNENDLILNNIISIIHRNIDKNFDIIIKKFSFFDNIIFNDNTVYKLCISELYHLYIKCNFLYYLFVLIYNIYYKSIKNKTINYINKKDFLDIINKHVIYN
jgi:hypothetical protein